MTYTTEASFLAAIGGSADVTENFNAFSADQPFRNSSFDAGPFTLSSSGAAQNTSTQNTIDVDPFAFGDFANIDDTPFAHFFVAGDGTASVTTATLSNFDQLTGAFGATFRGLDSATSIEVTTSSGVHVLTQSIGLGVAFFGFTLDAGDTLVSMAFSRTSFGDGFGMDNVLMAAPSSVPEPAVLALMALGALGLFVRCRDTV